MRLRLLFGVHGIMVDVLRTWISANCGFKVSGFRVSGFKVCVKCKSELSTSV